MENSCEVDEDIDGTYALLEGEKAFSNYDFIYSHSNECLSELFKYFDVKDKRVLTVLSSSDQLFNCLSSTITSLILLLAHLKQSTLN